MEISRAALGQHYFEMQVVLPSFTKMFVTCKKKRYLEDFIFEKSIKIFGVTETILQNAAPTSIVDIRGYTFERYDRSSRKGEVGVYIKDNIEYICRNNLNDENVEAVWIDILQNNSKGLYLVYYIDPRLARNI